MKIKLQHNKNSGTEVRAKAQGLKTLCTLLEDPGSVPITPGSLQLSVISSWRTSGALFWPLWTLHACCAQTYV